MATLLGLDLGTTGIKALLMREDGQILATATEAYPLLHPQPGWAEQQPEDWWQATIRAIRACLAQGGASDLRGLAISGQMHGAVLLDGQDQVLRPCIIWADTRCQAECDQITATVGQARLIDLVSNPALPGFTAPKLPWVRNHEPEVWARVRRVLLPKDYLRLKLTGVAAIEISDAAGTCLLNVTDGAWSQEVLASLDLDPALLPPIVGAGEIAGHVTPEVAALTGLPVGLPVAGGGADNACAAIGAGIVAPGQALVSIGTSGVVLAFSATPQVDRSGPIPRVHTFNHAIPHAWYLMGVTQGAGLSLRWARDQLSGPATPLTYEAINAEAATVPAGSAGLLFLPYLQGERTPWLDAQARGGWVGLTSRHTRAHLFRSVMEGVAFSLFDCLSVLHATGVAITELRATGGGVRSELWRQILADVFNQPLLPLATEEGPALGAALLAGIATNLYPSAQAACAALVRLAPATLPIPALAKRYQALYPPYHALYPALQETMHALGEFEA